MIKALENNISPIKLALIISIWFIYSGVYITLTNIQLSISAGYFALFSQVGMDGLISILTFKLYQKANKNNLKLIYLLFFFSAVSAMVADGVYHAAMNIIDVNNFNVASSFFEVPFILFLFFQVIAWLSIFFIDYKIDSGNKIPYLPYLTVSVFIFFTFVYAIPWQIHYLSKLGIYQLIDTSLEVIGFSLSTVCLARSKNDAVRYLAIGYLCIISSDLLIRYEVISGQIPFLSVFEVSWCFGLLLMSCGFFSLKNAQIRLLPLNSLQSHIAIWLLNLLSLFVSLLLVANYFLPYKEISNYLLLVVVPCAFIAIIFSKYFSEKILSPLKRLESIVEEFITEGAAKHTNQLKHICTDIEDFILLEKFIYDSFDLYKKDQQIKIEFAKRATQVAHDIKSPMIALNNYFKEAVRLDKTKYQVVESSLHRINEIANNLLIDYKKSEINFFEDKNDIDLVVLFITSIMEEKKLQYKDSLVEINLIVDQFAELTFVKFNAISFKRTLSNLINNAVDATSGTGLITISLIRESGHLVLEIKDNGCGIPKEVLKNIEHAQYRNIKKINGNGLGLPYALQSIKEWGARYQIESLSDEGTKFKIMLPIQLSPSWFQEEIYVYDKLNIVIIDDDHSIFQLWKEKLVNTGNKILKCTYLSSSEELKGYLNQQSSLYEHLFLVDYHFDNSNFTGIDLIKEFALKNTVLVTNKYPDSTLKIALEESNISFILKNNIPHIKICNIHENPDLILVDDKKFVRDMWIIESQKHGKKIVTFPNKNMLMQHIELFDKKTHIYLDLDLNNDSGDVVAQNIYNLGYRKLYITTGYDLTRVNKSPWILDVISKEPPFSKCNTSIEE